MASEFISGKLNGASVEGFDELFKAMDNLSQEIGEAKTMTIWRKALGEAMRPVLESAKSRAPTDTGQLRDHIYMKVQRPTARDKASSSYQGETVMARVTLSPKRVDSQTETLINEKGKEKTRSTHRPVALAMEFGTASVAAKPFMRPALQSNIDIVLTRLKQYIWSEINWGKYAKKGS